MSQSPSLVRPPRLEELVVDDGEPLESARHRQQMVLLIESLEYAWRERDDFYVGGNMFLYYSETQTRKNDFRGPDVFVALGTDRRERQAWVVWLEGGKTPDVIVELTSASTADIDHRDKVALYQRLKIGEYFIFDPFSAALEGMELDTLTRTYRPKVLDESGRLTSRLLGLGLGSVTSRLWGVEAPWLRWLDARGEPLPFPSEAAVALEERVEEVTEALRNASETLRNTSEALRDAEEKREHAEGLAREYERRFGPLKP